MEEIVKGDIWYITRNKNRMETTKCAQDSALKGIKSYIVVANDDDLILGASTISYWITLFLKIVGYNKVAILSGHPPVPPHCPPTGCATGG